MNGNLKIEKDNIVAIEDTSKDKEYFISTKDEKNDFLVYGSELFKLSEIDLINLIKVCLIEARNKTIGKKILAIYRDSTQHRADLTKKRLNLIGIQEQEISNPIKFKSPKIK